jgi:large-conductance mechanosensitive channel
MRQYAKGFQGVRHARQCRGLAVGIIIGAAFGKIVSSFVSDILMLSGCSCPPCASRLEDK